MLVEPKLLLCVCVCTLVSVHICLCVSVCVLINFSFPHSSRDRASRPVWSPLVALSFLSQDKWLPPCTERWTMIPDCSISGHFTWLNIGQSLQATNMHYSKREKWHLWQWFNTQDQGFQVDLEQCDKRPGLLLTQLYSAVIDFPIAEPNLTMCDTLAEQLPMVFKWYSLLWARQAGKLCFCISWGYESFWWSWVNIHEFC